MRLNIESVKTMTKDEILKLHELDRKMAWAKLARWGVIKDITDAENELMVESLADCAFRLRDESYENYECFGSTAKHLLKSIDGVTNQVFRAKPIHWIQAALLARLEDK